MKCKKCNEKSVFLDPNYCKKHFIEYFESKVFKTIKEYEMLEPGQKICVATSGGKDSLTVLYLVDKYIKKAGGSVVALLIDEGISGYRINTEQDMKSFCKKYDIEFKVVSFLTEFGKTLDKILKLKKINQKPCTVCGVLRRYLLNKYSRGYEKLVVGHNMDDEAQVVVMNFLKNKMDLNARLGPVSGIIRTKKFTPRVKPLYFCSEKEVATYSFIKGFTTVFTECPYVESAFRLDVRESLNEYESNHKGTKLNIIKMFLKMLPKLREGKKGMPSECIKCGEPTAGKVCNTCVFVEQLK